MKTKLTKLVITMVLLGGSIALGGGGSSVGDGPRKVAFSAKESIIIFWALEEVLQKPGIRTLDIKSISCSMTVIPGYPVTCSIEGNDHCYYSLGGEKAKALFMTMHNHYEPKDPNIVGAVTLELENLFCNRRKITKLIPACYAD